MDGRVYRSIRTAPQHRQTDDRGGSTAWWSAAEMNCRCHAISPLPWKIRSSGMSAFHAEASHRQVQHNGFRSSSATGAREILMLCENIPASKALEWGLLNRVVPRCQLDNAVDELAEKLINKLPECTRYAKQQLNFWRDLSWSMTIGHVKDWLTVHTGSAEVQEGVRAFVEKRPIDYKKFRQSNLSSTSSAKKSRTTKRRR